MIRGEIPIELGASWFSPKCVEAQRGVIHSRHSQSHGDRVRLRARRPQSVQERIGLRSSNIGETRRVPSSMAQHQPSLTYSTTPLDVRATPFFSSGADIQRRLRSSSSKQRLPPCVPSVRTTGVDMRQCGRAAVTVGKRGLGLAGFGLAGLGLG